MPNCRNANFDQVSFTQFQDLPRCYQTFVSESVDIMTQPDRIQPLFQGFHRRVIQIFVPAISQVIENGFYDAEHYAKLSANMKAIDFNYCRLPYISGLGPMWCSMER